MWGEGWGGLQGGRDSFLRWSINTAELHRDKPEAPFHSLILSPAQPCGLLRSLRSCSLAHILSVWFMYSLTCASLYLFSLFLLLPRTVLSYHSSLFQSLERVIPLSPLLFVFFPSQLSISTTTLHSNAYAYYWVMTQYSCGLLYTIEKMPRVKCQSFLSCEICGYSNVSSVPASPYLLSQGDSTFIPSPPMCWLQYPDLLMTDTHLFSQKIVALFSDAV